jgi:SMODS-associated and fused to various effectors sensor domain
LAWVTPEVLTSDVIRRVEVPEIIRRIKSEDSFFGMFVAAGGLDYDGAARAAAENLGTTDLHFWNQYRVDGNPATATELDGIAERLLGERLKRITANLPTSEPLRVGFWVRRQPPLDADAALQLDWAESFTGRHANLGAWKAELLPALASLHREVGRRAGGRSILVTGTPTLAAAVALGRAFPAVAGIPIRWEQLGEDGNRTEWSLSVPAEPNDYSVTTAGVDPGGEALAVLVSVAHDAALAFGATSGLPRMRASIEVAASARGGGGRLSPGGARRLAADVAATIRRARTELLGVRDIHLFVAAPVGLALMLGQLLNAVGPVVVYEHVDSDAVGFYRPEVRLPGGTT